MITKSTQWKYGHKVWYRQFDNEFVVFPATVLKFLGLHGSEILYEVGKVDRGIAVRRTAPESQLSDASDDPNFTFKEKGFYDPETGQYRLRSGAVCKATFRTGPPGFESAGRNNDPLSGGGEGLPPNASAPDSKGTGNVSPVPVSVEPKGSGKGRKGGNG